MKGFILVSTLSSTERGGLPSPSEFFCLRRVPAIHHGKSPVVPCPSKVLLRNARSTLSINKSGASVRRLRSKSRPFVIAPELAIPPSFATVSCRSHLVSS